MLVTIFCSYSTKVWSTYLGGLMSKRFRNVVLAGSAAVALALASALPACCSREHIKGVSVGLRLDQRVLVVGRCPDLSGWWLRRLLDVDPSPV